MKRAAHTLGTLAIAALVSCGDGAGSGTTTATLPLAIDDYFAASGYFGDGATPGAISDSPGCTQRAGSHRGVCHLFTWTPITPATSFAGVYWQYPANNWGTDATPGRTMPQGAKSISFWAWGKSGGEQLQFFAGLQPNDGFKVQTNTILLNTTPTQYTINLAKVTYATVISGFGWAAGAQGTGPIVFSVDDIVWSADAATGSQPGCTDPNAANYNAAATTDDGSCTYNVTFQVDMTGVSVSPSAKMQIRSTFNGFCADCNLLSLGSNNVWTSTLPIPSGSYGYKYAMDATVGGFETVPEACAKDTSVQPADRTRPLTVAKQAQTLPLVKWGACP
ncbi:MAG: hypothetical protein JST92_21400 [Deltaproteobacteria bacterium]|nr:hypothetical protein [Deltaproteobacteria bacterium]